MTVGGLDIESSLYWVAIQQLPYDNSYPMTVAGLDIESSLYWVAIQQLPYDPTDEVINGI